MEYDEPMGYIPSNVIEHAESKEHLPAEKHEPYLQALEPVAELPQSPVPSTKSTPATTPRTSTKFKKDVKNQKVYDFGKSKFTSKHEVIKRGKEVEVKLDSLKLGKEDVLRVVVMGS